jgi:hypothetical protein
MEMPRDGLCDLAFSFLDGTFCTIEGNRCSYCDDGAIPKWCPIICQLPEGHGRLVDADALRNQLIKNINLTNGFDTSFRETATIVPAERSEQ